MQKSDHAVRLMELRPDRPNLDPALNVAAPGADNRTPPQKLSLELTSVELRKRALTFHIKLSTRPADWHASPHSRVRVPTG